MSVPKHKNPVDANGKLIPDRTACAPYNFVPLPEVVIKAVEDPAELPDHDRYYPNRKSGYFDVKLTTKSPLYVRCPLTRDQFDFEELVKDKNGNLLGPHTSYADRIKNTPDFFFTSDRNRPLIPGSSLRGMLRSFLEVLSYAKVQPVTNAHKIFYRAVAAPTEDPLKGPYEEVLGRNGRDVRAGYLTEMADGWHIHPAKSPRDMTWHETKPYLPIKNNLFDRLTLPELIRFRDPSYRPQYLPVSFNVETLRSRSRRVFESVSAISADLEKYLHKGVIVASGNMHETESTDSESPRTTYALVLERSVPEEGQPSKILKINKQAVSDYLDSLTAFQKQQPPFDPILGCLSEGRPVFYVKPEKGNEVYYFGHTPNFRVPATITESGVLRGATPIDFVPAHLRSPIIIDYAEALFGYTDPRTSTAKQGEKAHAYASRILVSDATLNGGQNHIWLSDNPIVPKSLASPKLTAFQHYLTQQEPNLKARLAHYGSPPPHETVIRGHKRYWHHGLNPDDGISLEDIHQYIQEDREALREMEDRERAGKGDTQHTQFKPVRPNLNFTFRVNFDNLSEKELGALCWVLHPLGDTGKTYCHSLGMGKPLGMGAVKLDAALHLTDRPTRYTKLFNEDGWETGEKSEDLKALSNPEALAALVKEFEKALLKVLQPRKLANPSEPCTHLSDLKRIGMLLKMMEWPGFPAAQDQPPFLNRENRSNTRYMTIQPNEYSNRPVLPDPSAFGQLTGDALPAASEMEDTLLTPIGLGQGMDAGGFINTAGKIQASTPSLSCEREVVSLKTNIKNGKAKVSTDKGETVSCTGFPPYTKFVPPKPCTVALTREEGKAKSAVFKGWVED
jgi:CRISPR-associated protein (TIGR03986 family)